MNLVPAIAACGIWPALPSTGFWLFMRPQRCAGTGLFTPLTSLALMTVAGLAVWSGLLLPAAIAGVYRPEWFGVAGWVVTLLTLARLPWQSAWLSLPGRKDFIWDGVLLAGLAFTAWLYLRYPNESIFCGADEGIYANHAIYIAHHGRLDVPYPGGDEVGPCFAKEFEKCLALPGLYDTKPTITVQFGHLFPIWLAQAFATLGHHGLFRLNGALALLSLLVFCGLCRTVLPRPLAVAATLFLALNPSQMWLARITLTEIFAQLLIWSGFLLLLQAGRDANRFLARWAGVFLAVSALVRVDAFLLAPLLFLSHLGMRLVQAPAERGSRAVWLAFHQAALPLFTLAAGYYRFFSAPYFLDLKSELIGIGLFAAVSLVALLTPTAPMEAIRPWLTSRAFLLLAGGVLAGLIAYAYWVRPALYGQSFVSWTLVNLGRYLSPPVIWAAAVGWWLVLAAVLRRRISPFWLVVLMVSAGFSFLYLWRPSVDPYHFWAVRRYVPVVIPGMVFFAAFAVSRALDRLPRAWAAVPAAATLVYLAGFTIQADALIYRFAENEWFFGQLRAIARELPENDWVLAYGGYERMLPLFLAFDRKVIPIDPRQIKEEAEPLIRSWIDARIARGQAVYLLSENCRFVGEHIRELHHDILTRYFCESTWNPLPRKILTELQEVHLYRITRMGTPADYLNIPLGYERVWGVDESGFHGLERARSRSFRRTNGAAKLRAALDPGRLPKALKVTLGIEALGMSLRVLVNGRELFQGPLPEGRWSRTFDVSGIPLDGTAVIELLSTALVPGEAGEQSGDEAPRGVRVSEIRLMERQEE
jgi:hypothetical protein